MDGLLAGNPSLQVGRSMAATTPFLHTVSPEEVGTKVSPLGKYPFSSQNLPHKEFVLLGRFTMRAKRRLRVQTRANATPSRTVVEALGLF